MISWTVLWLLSIWIECYCLLVWFVLRYWGLVAYAKDRIFFTCDCEIRFDKWAINIFDFWGTGHLELIIQSIVIYTRTCGYWIGYFSTSQVTESHNFCGKFNAVYFGSCLFRLIFAGRKIQSVSFDWWGFQSLISQPSQPNKITWAWTVRFSLITSFSFSHFCEPEKYLTCVVD